MDYYKLSVDECIDKLGSNIDGLSKSEVEERLLIYGPNLVVVKGKSIWKKLIEPFKDIFIFVLFVAALISIFKSEYADAAIIITIIVADVLIYYIQLFSTDRVLKSLQKKNNLIVDVLHGGQSTKIDASLLVPGDIVVIEEGDKIPADCRLITIDSLRVDESQMTGESMPIEKQTEPLSGNKEVYDHTNMVYCGSYVIGGQARALVVNTGNNTEYGKLAKLSISTGEQSPVQKKINKLVSSIIKVITIIAAVAFTLALYRGMNFSEALRYILALSVSAVPEGLLVAITVVLVLGMRRMAKKKALVKNQAAIETIGIVTVIATDKTGTLTKNMLTLQKVWQIEKSEISINKAIAYSYLPAISKSRDPLDTAMESYISKSDRINNSDLISSLPFSQQFSMSGNIIKGSNGKMLFVKGAPEKVLERCNLSAADKEDIHSQILSMAELGLRVLSLAYVKINKDITKFEDLEKNTKFSFVGLVGVADVIRPEAVSAIKRAHSAGIKVCMVTGDHFETAFHIAKQLSFVESRDEVFDSSKMNDYNDEKLSELVATVRVFSRVTPDNKHRLLSILKQNEITAMTGDGVNDVPALTKAHVGVAMGAGTSIAKDAGDIILLDNNFRSIIDAVHEGRTIYANIKRMVAYLLSTNAGEVVISLGALIIGVPVPLVAVQILWVNLVTDTCMVIPLGLEPGEKRNILRPPVKQNGPLFSKFMVSRILLTTSVMAATVLGLYLYFLNIKGVEYARTIAFNALVVVQWASAFNSRSDYESIIKRIFRVSPVFYLGLSLAVTSQIIALSGLLHTPLRISVLPGIQDLLITSIFAFLVPIIVIEIHKWLGRRFFNKGSRRGK